MATTILDTTGLLCPLPVLKARKALKGMPPGALLQVIATDKGAVKDFDAFCRTTGDTLVEQRTEGESFIFLIRKAGPAG